MKPPIKNEIANSFSNRANTYDLHSDIQKESLNNLLSHIYGDFQNILDIGCGTGCGTALLAERFPEAKVIGLDVASGMIEKACEKFSGINFVIGDAEALPFSNNSFDLIVSNASLQWIDPQKFFKETSRVLTKDGALFFTTFGPETLIEAKKIGVNINSFDSTPLLQNIGEKYFPHFSIRREKITKEYKDMINCLKSIKNIGAGIRKEKSSVQNLAKIRSSLKIKPFYATWDIIIGECRKDGL